MADAPAAGNEKHGRGKQGSQYRGVVEGAADGFRKLVQEIARSRALPLELSCTEELPAVPLDPVVCERLREAA
ncbi:MAG TPA: hypothetical protein VFB30_21730, partial [Spirochaetia bacterium]|nr:hypothetical protein [Spirochaetia bacterium]